MWREQTLSHLLACPHLPDPLHQRRSESIEPLHGTRKQTLDWDNLSQEWTLWWSDSRQRKFSTYPGCPYRLVQWVIDLKAEAVFLGWSLYQLTVIQQNRPNPLPMLSREKKRHILYTLYTCEFVCGLTMYFIYRTARQYEFWEAGRLACYQKKC